MNNINNLSIAKAMNDIYQDNLYTLKQIDTDLYKRILNLSKNIQNNKYLPRYEIKLHNNSLNIYDKQKEVFLYDKTIEEYNKNIVNEYANFNTDNTINHYISALYDIKHLYGKKPFNIIGDLEYSEIFYQKDILEYKKILNFPIVNKSKELKYIPNFIFFGTLLGQHTVSIAKHINAKYYLIVEPNLELFRLSLFTTEYKLLFQNSYAIFCIEKNKLDTIKTMELFITLNKTSDYIFKYHLVNSDNINLLNDFKLTLKGSSKLSYDHYRQLEYVKNTIKNVNKYRLLQCNTKKNILLLLPIFILAPGPSLRKNIEFIKKNKNKIIIVAFSATLHILFEFNIMPDIITIVDSSPVMSNQFPKDPKYLKKLEKSILIASTNVHKSIFKLFKQNNIFLFESNYVFSSKGIPQSSAFTVGDSTLHILLSLGFKNIYLNGTDLSINKKTGSGYDKSHRSSIINYNNANENIKKIKKRLLLNDNIIIKANFGGEELLTTPFFFRILKNYKYIINKHKNVTIHNLSDGAFISHTIPTKIEDIDFEKTILNKDIKIKKILNNYSIFKFDIKTEKKVKKELKILYKLIKILEVFNKQEIYEYNEFTKFINKMIYLLKEKENISDYIKEIIFTYINININYLSYYFNDKAVVENHTQLNQLKNIFYKQFLKILKKQIKYLERI